MKLLLALLLLAPQEERKPRGLAGVGLKAEDVNRAIDRGAGYLRGVYADRSLGDSTNDIVAVLALLHADAHTKHPDLAPKIRKWLGDLDPRTLGTYELGVLAMIYEHLADPQHLPRLRLAVQRLLDLQGEDGSWGYGEAETPRADALGEGTGKPPKLRVAGGRPLNDTGGGEVLKRQRNGPNESGRDNSASQYAVLGLYSGLRAGLRIDPESWKRALRYYAECQVEDGGWGYRAGDESYGSMTAAGIASVAIAGYALGDKEWKSQVSVRKGSGWLARRFIVTDNPGSEKEWHYYYLYGLERVGRILDTEFIGEHEWYPLGAKFLVGAQEEDGRWVSEADGDDVLTTSFALLFLTRATPSPMVRLKRGGKGRLVTAAATGTANYYLILDCSGSMQPKMGARRKFDVAQDAVCSIVEALPDGSKAALRAYGHHRIVNEEAAERDTELLIPFGPVDKKAFVARVRKLDCFGRTPITLSLEETAKDLAGPGEAVTVVLLTDGGESTRGAEPAKAAAALVESLPKAVLHVVAFDVNNPRERKQSEEIASAGRGRCFAAAKAEDLVEQLRQVFGARIPYELADKDGKKIADGGFGDRRELPEGKYRIRCVIRGEKIDEEFWINTDETTTIAADLTDERPAERRGGKSGLDVTIGGAKAALSPLSFSLSGGSIAFEGALSATFETAAEKPESLKGLELALEEGAALRTSSEESLSSKRVTLRIESASRDAISGTIAGTFLRGDEEVQVRGRFAAAKKE